VLARGGRWTDDCRFDGRSEVISGEEDMAQSTTWSHGEVEPTPASEPHGRRRDIEHDPGPLFFLISMTAMPLTMIVIAWLALAMY
jgi:hypothetical protein